MKADSHPESHKSRDITIPGFEIGPVLGEGGMATVYLAEQISLSRQVALKIMSPTLITTDSGFCERFINEGRIIAKLRHQNIVTIHDIGCANGQDYFMAMEYCPGGTLKHRILDGSARLHPLAVIRQVAAALGYAHDHGFIHRDIKPGNILFRDDGTAVLSDFGIAKTLDTRTRITREGWAIGTPEYMSPEQASGQDLAPSSDLYSLGVVLYEMLTGQKPFRGSDALATAMQHANAPIPRLPSEFVWLQHVLDGLLAKHPADRIASTDALIAEIDALERAQPRPRDEDATRFLGPVVGHDVPTLPPKAFPQQAAGSPTRYIGLVAALGVVVAGLSWLALSAIPMLRDTPTGGETPLPALGGSEVGAVQEDAESPGASERVNRLLDIARAHMAVGRLREPVGSNAYEAYSLVLEIDPNNAEARSAMRRIERLSETN